MGREEGLVCGLCVRDLERWRWIGRRHTTCLHSNMSETADSYPLSRGPHLKGDGARECVHVSEWSYQYTLVAKILITPPIFRDCRTLF